MSLSEDQHAVGEFGSDGSDESFGVAVGLWTPERDLHDMDAGVGKDGVEGCSELSGSVADQEPEAARAFAEVSDQVGWPSASSPRAPPPRPPGTKASGTPVEQQLLGALVPGTTVERSQCVSP